MRVAVIAEFYPRADDPVSGVWAHRQALATAEAGAEVTVFVLHRIVPPARNFNLSAFKRLARHPAVRRIDGLDVHYLRYLSPPRGRSYATWGRWAARALRRALDCYGPFDLIHAHNAIPAGDAVLRTRTKAPLVISIHGGDVLFTAAGRVPNGARAVERTLSRAELTLANSAGIEALARRCGARRTEVVHLGADLVEPPPRSATPLLVTVGHLVARKRHADVIEALAKLPDELRYLVIGDGPERRPLEQLAENLGVGPRVEFAGQLGPRAAWERAGAGWLFVMPSLDEAFGVAYIEAMAAGVPAIGARGEPGPTEIAAAGPGIECVPPRDPAALAEKVSALTDDRERLTALGQAARTTVAEHFSWRACGVKTLAAYQSVLTQPGAGAAP